MARCAPRARYCVCAPGTCMCVWGRVCARAMGVCVHVHGCECLCTATGVCTCARMHAPPMCLGVPWVCTCVHMYCGCVCSGCACVHMGMCHACAHVHVNVHHEHARVCVRSCVCTSVLVWVGSCACVRCLRPAAALQWVTVSAAGLWTIGEDVASFAAPTLTTRK